MTEIACRRVMSWLPIHQHAIACTSGKCTIRTGPQLMRAPDQHKGDYTTVPTVDSRIPESLALLSQEANVPGPEQWSV